jgi:hypothetical protein
MPVHERNEKTREELLLGEETSGQFFAEGGRFASAGGSGGEDRAEITAWKTKGYPKNRKEKKSCGISLDNLQPFMNRAGGSGTPGSPAISLDQQFQSAGQPAEASERHAIRNLYEQLPFTQYS